MQLISVSSQFVSHSIVSGSSVPCLSAFQVMFLQFLFDLTLWPAAVFSCHCSFPPLRHVLFFHTPNDFPNKTLVSNVGGQHPKNGPQRKGCRGKETAYWECDCGSADETESKVRPQITGHTARMCVGTPQYFTGRALQPYSVISHHIMAASREKKAVRKR